MTIRHWAPGLAALGLGLLLTFGAGRVTPRAAAQQGPELPQQEGVEPQGRGPVHEAFAEPGSARPEPLPVVAKQPPEPVNELPPDQKPDGDNVQWIPGYWTWNEETSDYLWVSGCWRAFPPGRTWMPGTWAQVASGWQWTPGYWAAAAAEETEFVPPPPANIDNGPSAPAPTSASIYVNGCWVYRTRQFVWRPGFWYTPRPGWVYVPARYVWTPCGCVFVEGYWDYPLETRGCLFAPVVIERRCWSQPRWVYRPCCVVYTRALLGSLFVRPSCGCYYFGDYFEPRYRRLGFVAWVDFRIGRFCYDPLFVSCRWQYRSDPYWERNLRTLYFDRWSGRAPRPPRTLIQQTTVINNITINRSVNVTNVTLLAPINRVDRRVLALRPVSREQLVVQRRAAREIRTISKQRQQITTRILARGPAPTRPTDVSRVTRVRLPRPAAVRTNVTVKPPPLPVKPRPAERKAPRSDRTPHPAPKTNPAVNPGPRPMPRAEVRPNPRPTPRVEPRAQPKPMPRTEPRANPRPMPRTEPHINPKPTVHPPAKPQPRPTAVRPQPKPMPVKPAVNAPRPTKPAVNAPRPTAVKPAPTRNAPPKKDKPDRK
jgi:hypothetical protein